MNITKKQEWPNTKLFKEWEVTEENRYFTVEYTQFGKSFLCYIKMALDKNSWVSVYCSTTNPKDCFIRCETVSIDLWKHRKEINLAAWEFQFDRVIQNAVVI